jgi:hypothetical protein
LDDSLVRCSSIKKAGFSYFANKHEKKPVNPMIENQVVKSHFCPRNPQYRFNEDAKMRCVLRYLCGNPIRNFDELDEETKREAAACFAETIIGFTEADGKVVLYGPVGLHGFTFVFKNPMCILHQDLALPKKLLYLTAEDNPELYLSPSFHEFMRLYESGNSRAKLWRAPKKSGKEMYNP